MVAIIINGATEVSIENHGTLTGGAGLIIQSDQIDVRNDGVINGDVTFYGGSATCTADFHGGTVRGNIALTDTYDFFDGRDARITGTVYGGDGDDSYLINTSTIRLEEGMNDGFDYVFSSASYRLESNFEYLELRGSANLRGTGNRLDNYVTGNEGDNRLSGLDGADRVDGGWGDDQMSGGRGDDSMFGGLGDDLLLGGDGADLINSWTGSDTLTGGRGADTFLFYSVNELDTDPDVTDRITDFQSGFDRINLHDMDADSATPYVDDSFSVVASFSGTAGELVISQTGGMTYVSLDVDGDGRADGIIALNGALSLTASDFTL